MIGWGSCDQACAERANEESEEWCEAVYQLFLHKLTAQLKILDSQAVLDRKKLGCESPR